MVAVMTGGPGAATRRRLGAVLTAIAVALPLAACTDDPPSPPPTPTVSPTPTPSPTVTVSPPAAPEAEPSAESAEAFVRYFWDVFNYAHSAPDPAALAAISEPGCLFCASAGDVVTDLVRAKKHVQGGVVEVDTAAVPPGDLTKGTVVTLVISQSPGQTLDSKGVTSRTPGIRNMRSEIALDWTGTTWRVRDVANDEKSGSKW